MMGMGESETRYDLPDILPEQSEAWAVVEKRRFGPRMMAALQRMAGGTSAKEAAALEGYSDHHNLYANAKSCGLIDLTSKGLIGQHRSIAKLSLNMLERLLIDGKVSLTPSQLAWIAGVSTDKVTKSEEKGRDDGSTYLSALERAASAIAASGATLEITVSVKPADPTLVTLEPEPVQLLDTTTSSG
jgi:hypothetical protein